MEGIGRWYPIPEQGMEVIGTPSLLQCSITAPMHGQSPWGLPLLALLGIAVSGSNIALWSFCPLSHPTISHAV